MKPKTTHGGFRPGSGRKAGSGKGRTVKTGSISLPPALWAKLDAIRERKSRSAWIAEKIERAKCPHPDAGPHSA